MMSIERAFIDALNKESERIREELISASVKDFETRLRRAVGNAAIDLSQYFSVQSAGGDLLIRVKMEGK